MSRIKEEGIFGFGPISSNKSHRIVFPFNKFLFVLHGDFSASQNSRTYVLYKTKQELTNKAIQEQPEFDDLQKIASLTIAINSLEILGGTQTGTGIKVLGLQVSPQDGSFQKFLFLTVDCVASGTFF